MTVVDVAAAQRRLTAAFVARAPVEVEFSRVVTSDDGEGGRTTARVALWPQVVTLCEPPSSGYGAPSSAADGRRSAIDSLLVGAWDLDVADGDEFDHVGTRYRVDRVLPDNGWERRGYVVKVGRT